MIWLRFLQWVLWAHVILLCALMIGGVFGTILYCSIMMALRGIP